jgi:hypothetical protein
MAKLLIRYCAKPTLKNAQAIRAYDRKHPFARCMFSLETQDEIADAIHHANSGKRVDASAVRS